MNKRIIFIAVILICLTGLSIILLILAKEPKTSAAAELPAEEYIYTTTDVSAVTVRNSHGEYTMRGGNNPEIIGYENLPVSTFYFIHILDVSSRLVSRGLVADNASDPANFGLDPPQAQIIIQQKTGEEITLYIGSSAPDGNVYVKLKEKEAIYLASMFDIIFFYNGLFDLVDTSLTPPAQKDDEGNLVFNRITLAGLTREEFTIVNTKQDNSVFSFYINPIRIITPVNTPVSNEHVPVIESLFGLYADRFITILSDNEETRRKELNSYGLTQPWSTAEIVTANGNSFILISKPDNEGMVYIHREGTQLIYETAASGIPWLEISWFELMNKMVLLNLIDNVSAVDIKTEHRTVTFLLSGAGNNLSVKTGATDIEIRNFRNFYQTLAAARYDEYSDVPYSSLPPPFLEIVYHYRDRNKNADTVSFHQAASRRVLTSLNQGRPHFTLSVYTDQILSDLELILSGQRVRSYL